MDTAHKPMDEWNDLSWKHCERRVFKLQKRIYQASRRGDRKTVHHLQRLLTHSWSARCLAVRKVTQDNQGKKTAGVDGVKERTPSQRRNLPQSLRLRPTAQPVRRVWIPKPGSDDKRPLGIPTMHDRAAHRTDSGQCSVPVTGPQIDRSVFRESKPRTPAKSTKKFEEIVPQIPGVERLAGDTTGQPF